MIPLKENSQGLIIEVISALKPHFDALNASWREKLASFGLEPAILRILERITIGYGANWIIERDFSSFFENLNYNGVRLAKLQTDTRLVALSLELYQELCEPYLVRVYGEEGLRRAQPALEMLRSATFITFTGAYFDTKTAESHALVRVLDAELRAEELAPMLQQMLELTTGIFRADFGAVLLSTLDGSKLKVESVRGVEAGELAGLTLALEEGISHIIASTGEPQLVSNTAEDVRVRSEFVRRSMRSIWGVPLKTDHKVLGVLLIGFKRHYEWFPTERELLRAIADRSVSAIERAQMTGALKEREQRIAELSGYLLRAQEEERKRISRELHDETGQALMVIRLYLGMLDHSLTARSAKAKVRETVEVVDRTIEGIRRIIGRLSPLLLQELGLTAAIRKEAKDLAKTTGVRVRVMVADEQERFAPEAETAVYRVVQEALHNVAKHAQAKSVTIKLTREDDVVKLSVQDDGVGISTRQSGRGHSFGLAGIKERVASLGGTVLIWSEKNQGTRLEISVPARPVAAELIESA